MRCMGFLPAARHNSSKLGSALARSVGCGDPLFISRGNGDEIKDFRTREMAIAPGNRSLYNTL